MYAHLHVSSMFEHAGKWRRMSWIDETISQNSVKQTVFHFEDASRARCSLEVALESSSEYQPVIYESEVNLLESSERIFKHRGFIADLLRQPVS
jgi:hypothetical protein